MRILAVNAGSSSLKLSVIGSADEVDAAVEFPGPTRDSMAGAISAFLATAPPFDVAGHRIVHGGDEFQATVVLDDRVTEALDRLVDLAPLHNPAAVEGVAVLRRLRPSLPQVACFDTAFHAGLPLAAATYALPHDWNSRWHLRRFGFHGLSHSFASRRSALLIGRPINELRLVTAHIGSGASLCAVAAGRSIDTTMGFTPLEGLVMGTRAGDVDPGLVLWLLRHGGVAVAEVEDALEHRSGLLGLSGLSSDLRVVLAAADGGEEPAALAYAVYLHRLRAGVAAMAAAMGGLDGLVFTGGAGQSSARLRGDTCSGLAFLGVEVDDRANGDSAADRVISPAAASTAVVVVAAREDLEIAREARAALGHAHGGR